MSAQQAEQAQPTAQQPTAPVVTISTSMAGAVAFALEAGIAYRDTVNALNAVSQRMKDARASVVAQENQGVLKQQRKAQATARATYKEVLEDVESAEDAEIATAVRGLASASAPLDALRKKAQEAVSDDDIAKAKELRKDVKQSYATFDKAVDMQLVRDFLGK